VTNFDKITHILYEVFDIKPDSIVMIDPDVRKAALIMDQVDAGEEFDIVLIARMVDKVAMIVCDYIASFNEGGLTDEDWEFVLSYESKNFFNDDREPLPVVEVE
jgi:hypothetical protein